jgi:Tn7-like transposition protein D
MLNYYPTRLLEDLECSIEQSEENWLAHWTTMSNPLHHLLLIQFLCGTAQEFFATTHCSPAPFGNGPWPCLNPLCSHYKERTITSFKVKQYRPNRPVATFTCLCGFAYSRTGPDMDDEAIFRVGRISQHGHIWDQYLTTYWLDRDIPTLQVARRMYTDVKTIRRQAARLGLPFAPDIPDRGKRPRIYQDCINDQRNLHRSLWEEALKAHPDAGITEIVKAAYKAYAWLKRHDSTWLQEHYPIPVGPLLNNKRLLFHKMQVKQESYSLIDAGLARFVKKTAEEIYVSSDFPVRVTRQLLAARIGSISFLKRAKIASGFLPLTTNAFTETVETSTAFIRRKLRWAVQYYLTEQMSLPSYRTFLKRARVTCDASTRPVIKRLIQIAYSNLRNGTLLLTPT